MKSTRLSRRASVHSMPSERVVHTALKRRKSVSNLTVPPWSDSSSSRLSPSERRRRRAALWHIMEIFTSHLHSAQATAWVYWQRYVHLHKTKDLQECATSISENTAPGSRSEGILETLLAWLKMLDIPILNSFRKAKDQDGLKLVANYMQLKRFPSNSILEWQASIPLLVYIILSGQVETWYNPNGAKAEKNAVAFEGFTYDKVHSTMAEHAEGQELRDKYNLRRKGFFGALFRNCMAGECLGGLESLLVSRSNKCGFTSIVPDEEFVVCLCFKKESFLKHIQPRLVAHRDLNSRIQFIHNHHFFHSIAQKPFLVNQIALSLRDESCKSRGQTIVQYSDSSRGDNTGIAGSDLIFLRKGLVCVNIFVTHEQHNSSTKKTVDRKVCAALVGPGELLGYLGKFPASTMDTQLCCRGINFSSDSSVCRWFRLSYDDYALSIEQNKEIKCAVVARSVKLHMHQNLQFWLVQARKEYLAQVRTLGLSSVEHRDVLRSRWKHAEEEGFGGDEAVKELNIYLSSQAHTWSHRDTEYGLGQLPHTSHIPMCSPLSSPSEQKIRRGRQQRKVLHHSKSPDMQAMLVALANAKRGGGLGSVKNVGGGLDNSPLPLLRNNRRLILNQGRPSSPMQGSF